MFDSKEPISESHLDQILSLADRATPSSEASDAFIDQRYNWAKNE
jgi:hypothetical protein